MSFSLSSLLNPTPDAQDRTETGRDDAVEHTQSQSPTLTRDSLPANNSLPSPELLQAQLPKYTPPQRSNASLIATRGNSEAQPIKDDRAPDQTTTSAREDHGSVHDTSTLSQATSLQSKMLVTGQPVPTILTTESLTQPENERDVVMKEDGKREDDRSTINRPPASHMDTHLGPISASTEVQGEQEPVIKQEARSPLEIPADQQSLSTQAVDDAQASKTITSLKHEYASRTQSPLRESSVALPTTEDTLSNTTTTKKRAGPAKAKKGTATIARKTKPTIKKRKVEIVQTALKNGKDASSPTPSDSQSMQADDDDDESMVDSDEDVEGSGGVYCICRKPDNGTFMIGCDGKCDDWFHGKCVSIEERDKNLIDKYICPRCAEAGVGRTSWKRMCRRESCRQPARVGRNAGKDGATSKYCSDECGVLFFRQMTASARGNDELKRDRGGRRKSGHGTKADEARGGILNAGEIRAMLDQTDNAAEFRELGNGVLSPPATPSADVDTGEDLTEQDHTALNAIATQKDQARQRHQSLKDRLKFISLVKLEATRAAVEKELKPKDYCGFDSRLEWTEEEFAAWRQTPQGQQVFEIESLEPKADAVAHEGEDVEVCTRKKCARHADWSKLAVDDVRFEMTDNSDRMRTLEQDEQDLRDRAMLRAKARKFNNDDTRVELHADDMTNGVNGAVPSQSEAMDIDHAV